MLTPDESLAKIRELKFPPIFERIWAQEFPFGLAGTCQQPRTYFRILVDLETRLPRFKNCVPLWEENGERILAYDRASREFISLYYEDPDCTVVGKTYQQFVSAFLMEIVYAGQDDELSELAELFHYQHLDRLRHWAETGDESSCDDSERKFLENIDD